MKFVLSGEQSPWQGHLFWAQLGITAAFFVEMVLRLLAEQGDYFCGPNWRWNIFESAILVTNVLDLLSSIQAKGAKGLSAFRCVRFVRVFRVVRVIRVFRFLRQMRLMVFTMIASFSAFIWAVVLLLLMVFVSACYLEDLALDYMRYHAESETPITNGFKEYWGGMYWAMYSMIYSISGGKDWGDLAEPFVLLSTVHGMVFTGIILFMLFGFFNVVVGVFVNETAGVDSLDPELIIQNSTKRLEGLSKSLRQIFEEIDEDGDGHLTVDEVKTALLTDRVSEELKHYDIDVAPENADTFLQVMDMNRDGVADVDEFVTGCLKLQGNAKPMSLVILTKKQDEMQGKLDFLVNIACRHRDEATTAETVPTKQCQNVPIRPPFW